MNTIIEQSKETLLRGLEEINGRGLQNPESLCNMEKLLKSYHYIAEMEMLEELGPEEYERAYGRYDRMYGRDGGNQRRYERTRSYRRTRTYGHDGDMHMFLEEQMRKAPTEQERERIRRLMEEAEY